MGESPYVDELPANTINMLVFWQSARQSGKNHTVIRDGKQNLGTNARREIRAHKVEQVLAARRFADALGKTVLAAKIARHLAL